MKFNKKILILLFTAIFYSETSNAQKLCEQFKFVSCPDSFNGSRNTSSASLPLNSAAMTSNPASMTVDRGFGAEIIKYRSYYDINLISGTGVIGSGFSTTNNEGSFFGNIPIEDINLYKARKINGDKYKSDKYTGVFAVNLYGKKKKNSDRVTVNLGLIGKYNQVTSQYKRGLGLSLGLGPLSLGAARINDDYMDSSNQQIKEYTTTSATAGVKVANVAFDFTYLKNDTETFSRVRLYTATVFLKNLMFSYGVRKEQTPYPKYLPDTQTFDDDAPNEDTFMGLQYIMDKRFLANLFYNYYLLNELSLGISFFI